MNRNSYGVTHRGPTLKPILRTLGIFRPKGFPGTEIEVKICFDDANLTLSYDRNGSLFGIVDPTVRVELENQLNLLEGHNLHTALEIHRQVGPIHVTDSKMFATAIYRSPTLDLRNFGIKVPETVRHLAFKELEEELNHPTNQIILDKDQVVKT